ncbi:DNA-binding transcriptional regulator, MarR family [Streptomyces sp. DvalAA-14]|uniref:MarR family winged helix-turn-helix transcriptional regulator n=1 Tax=unclassified Streptomyces TaxID=2593676 RepID=UPI00081BA06E|nr:MarR family winged helix-turn-helix transcriptional regulator [Streptomyces sp. DvalAA-14]MYS23757.1 MarR family transcriptional regulator [Streptomyces sp. SID4948]SCE38353.1 DNA-binding transcriptional regulator, MarR family [Streptomyces sp. DvalAA-14]
MSPTHETPGGSRFGSPDPRRVAAAWSAELDGLDVSPFLIGSAVQRVARHFERAFVRLTRAYSLGPGEMRVLLVLGRSAPTYAVSPTELFRQLLITSGAVSKQIDRLVDVGLVTRVADPDVPRGLLVRLEPAGKEIADAAMREICSSRYSGLEQLDQQEIQACLDMLTRLQQLVEESDADARP